MSNQVEIFPAPSTPLFDKIFGQIIKHDKFQYPSKGATISFINTEKSNKTRQKVKEIYKIELEWQNENICAVTVLKEVNNNDLHESNQSECST